MRGISIALALALAAAPAAFAKEPAQNISAAKHGNLAGAQALVRQAYDCVTAAQQADEFDLGGHATHAKQLLSQASDELKLAARTANGH